MIQEFEKFIARHGEAAAQAVLENLERYKGIHTNTVSPLEERWLILTQSDRNQPLAA